MIVDHGLGAALMRMNLPRKKLWEQFRIASPATNRAVFDEKMDVVQIGLVALALLLGRPLADDEYPAQVKRLIFSVKETSSRIGSRPIGPELRRWLERATGVDEAQTFNSIKEAQDAFEGVVAVDRYAPTAAAVKGFFLRYDELIAEGAAGRRRRRAGPIVEIHRRRRLGAVGDADAGDDRAAAPRRRRSATGRRGSRRDQAAGQGPDDEDRRPRRTPRPRPTRRPSRTRRHSPRQPRPRSSAAARATRSTPCRRCRTR